MFSARRSHNERSVTPIRLSQEQLDRFVTAHERFADRKPNGRRLILRFMQTPNVRLTGRNLSDAELTGICLYNANLEDAVLVRTHLFCGDLRNVQAARADFSRADLRGVSLRGASLNGAVLDAADMRSALIAIADEANGITVLRNGRDPVDAGGAMIGADGETAQFTVDFTGASMIGVRLEGANLKHANFKDAILTNARIKGARLDGASFAGAVLTGVDLSTAGLSAAQTQGCLLDPTPMAQMRVSILEQRIALAELWWRTDGKQGAAADLTGEDLRTLSGIFIGRSLTAMQAADAIGVCVNFSRAHLQGANFVKADLRGANFEGADLRGANFTDARLSHANFNQAQVGPLPLGRGIERQTNFAGAIGVNLKGADQGLLTT